MCAKTKEMRRFAIFLVVLISSVVSAEGFLENNLTMPEVPVEVPNTSSDDDSEQELSSQLQEVDTRSGGWSGWSAWSACSRTCDGGVAHQLRSCRSGSCRGDHIRYKICNMQISLTLFLALAVTTVESSVNILQGPSSKTTLIGPVSSSAPGGLVITKEQLASPVLTATEDETIVSGPAGKILTSYSHLTLLTESDNDEEN